MANGAGTLDAILAQLIIKLREDVAVYDESTCYLALDADDVPQPNPGDQFCVVAPLGGTFADSYFAGGGINTATAEAGFVTRIYSVQHLDQAGRDAVFLGQSAEGVISLVTETMKAVAGYEVPIEGTNRVRDQIAPAGWDIGEREPGGLRYFEISWRLTFDWDLT